mmetsp:Transcript_45543/g.114595  ORF Transcript_45543/g.114595 Transcript_45543/m.114595 type:complete len:754 (+) Transcript_45543:178-2439(+)|eukprot:CAMPEP_0177646406 /NCGR_PEP_ID=MMETSP0447-20121125/9758_1 /TAXON_ID=0 /ORGANISM="Stygamoeba regulata, Strain BSH-02190019" /LENGTH=753 /DNA_ID=CAMNT_0019148939 /DNA_START=69 /DNA_END=2330 /DNA_ORIENTATION=-
MLSQLSRSAPALASSALRNVRTLPRISTFSHSLSSLCYPATCSSSSAPTESLLATASSTHVSAARHHERHHERTFSSSNRALSTEPEGGAAPEVSPPSSVMPTHEFIPMPASLQVTARIKSIDEYREHHKLSIDKPWIYWKQYARDIQWYSDFNRVTIGEHMDGSSSWFLGGKLNACVNCIDRHLREKHDQVAIIWEGDEPNDVRKITYKELHKSVCRLANALKTAGVRKGDRVVIYMPMVPEAAFAMLACARIGAIHSVIFAGFSAEAVRTRVLDANASVVITANEGVRGGRHIPLKQTVDEALRGTSVRTVFVYKHTDRWTPWIEGRDIDLETAMNRERPYCVPEIVDSEDPLFILYTSGSTGQPKGLMHTTAGYLLYAQMTHRYIFDYQDGDVYACVADVGWITGHTYIVYGPLMNGATTLMFESLPTYPNPGRYWEMIERHRINSFYTAPTALRTLMASSNDFVTKHDRSSLKVLGSVGEPINPEAWKWYHEVVGEKRCAVVDTYWQTETGGIICSAIPGAMPMKAGSAALPFFGIDLAILDPVTGERLDGEHQTGDVEGVVAVRSTWPGMARSVYGDHSRYESTYVSQYPGFYFTGDGGRKDKDGYVWISGRVDDVITKAGHRLGTAEIESALTKSDMCSEAAVVPIPDPVKGQAIVAFCTIAEGFENEEDIVARLKQNVRKLIGPIAQPDRLIIAPSLPKTRSGKIMRRVLRKIAENKTNIADLGDLSTLAEPDVVVDIIARTHPRG